MDYPDFDVRSASIEATGYFLMAYFKSGDAAVAERFSDGLTMFLDTLVGIVKEEEEHQARIKEEVEREELRILEPHVETEDKKQKMVHNLMKVTM